MQINFANDLGYSSIKGIINGKYIHVPSIVHQTGDDFSTPDPIADNDAGAVHDVVSDYLDNMDVAVNSSAIGTTGRFFVGEHARISRERPTGFNIFSNQGKGRTDLAPILTLSVIAGYALQRYYRKYKKLPKSEIKANVNMVTALPIAEASYNHARRDYRKRYVGCDHTVTLKNFANPVSVKIHFNFVIVALEAQVAQYNIKYATDGLQKSIAEYLRDNYPRIYAQYAKDPMALLRSPHIMGIDLGDGTTDFASFQNGELNRHTSSSIKDGYGNVLTEASRELRSQGSNITTRDDLRNALNAKGLTAMQVKPRLEKAVRDNVKPLERHIVNEVSYDLSSVNAVDVIFVYGGGANPMKRYLKKPLQKIVDHVSLGAVIPIIFISPKYAQKMNVLGLQLVMNTVLEGADK